MSQSRTRKPATVPSTMPTTMPGFGPELSPSYVVGIARTWVCRFERSMGAGDMWRDGRAVRRLKVSTARVMEGLWLSDAKNWEMEREAWRIESPNGARGKPTGAM